MDAESRVGVAKNPQKQELPHKMIMSKMEHQTAPANSDKHSGPVVRSMDTQSSG